MSWAEIKIRHKELLRAAREGLPEAVGAAWAEFCAASRATPTSEVVHLATVFDYFDNVFADRPNSEIRILDHGTGTAINLLFLSALGYTDVWGVNVVDKAQPLNAVFRTVLEFPEDRIVLYDGQRLPFPDQCFDVVISQQVVEHVGDGQIDDYYGEEGRVLKPGGMAFHQVPHRDSPFDSHTNIWFLHYLPRPAFLKLCRFLGYDADYISSYIHLRWRRFHFHQAAAKIGAVQDLTKLRLSRRYGADAYDGANRLHAALNALLYLPLLGSVFRALAAHFLVAETVTTKPR